MASSLFNIQTVSILLQLSTFVRAFPSPAALDKKALAGRPVTATSYTPLACYTDLNNGQRTLGAASTASDAMTIDMCSAFCSKYKYFGVEFGRECWCGDGLQADQTTAAAETECNSPCGGQAQETCGAAARINVYTNNIFTAGTHATLADTPYIGCFADGDPRALPNNHLDSDAMTAATCAANCAGFRYFGTQWSRECWCGNTLPTTGAADEECSMRCTGSEVETCGGNLRLSIYGPNNNVPANTNANTNTGPVSPPAAVSNFAYQGCYTDNIPQRVLSGPAKFDDAMTLEMCAAFCTSSDYGVFGVEFGGECYCGNSVDTASAKKDDGECTMKCKGSNTEPCGDGNRLSVYALPAGTLPVTSNPTGAVNGFWYSSCWNDNVQGRSLSDNFLFADDMTVEKCSSFCQGYTYLGLEFGKECYCGNTLTGTVAPESDCSQHCAGDKKEFCGNGNRLSLFSTQQPSKNR